MKRRHTVVGLCMACALLVSAFLAQSANAETKGTTVFTCKKQASAAFEFNDAHCKEAAVPKNTGEYAHVPVIENTTTKVTVTSEKTKNNTTEDTPSVLKATIAGTPFELVAKKVHGEGGFENKKEAVAPNVGEHYFHTGADPITLKYTEVSEKLLGCTVTGIPGGVGTIETKPLTVTSTGQGESVEIKPNEGTLFAEFTLSGAGCSVANTYKVIGRVTCTPSRATLNCVHNPITEQKNLRLQSALGPVAGYEGSVTVKGKDEAAGDKEFTPLSVTTAPTA
jgi:hypothetical protein